MVPPCDNCEHANTHTRVYGAMTGHPECNNLFCECVSYVPNSSWLVDRAIVTIIVFLIGVLVGVGIVI